MAAWYYLILSFTVASFLKMKVASTSQATKPTRAKVVKNPKAWRERGGGGGGRERGKRERGREGQREELREILA